LCGVSIAVHAWWTGDFVVESSERTILQTEIATRTCILILVAVRWSHEVSRCLLAILSAWASDSVWSTVVSITTLFLCKHRCIWVVSWSYDSALVSVRVNILINWAWQASISTCSRWCKSLGTSYRLVRVEWAIISDWTYSARFCLIKWVVTIYTRSNHVWVSLSGIPTSRSH
jgi:hypothetical protein